MIKKFMPDLVLGIAARNEEKTIYATLESLINETKLFPKSVSISVHIVLNGCVDGTEQEIKRYISHHHHGRVPVNIKKIQNGLISAQQIIWKQKNKNNVIVFIDADIMFKQGSLYKLYAMASKPSTRVVWANVTPVYKPKIRSLSFTRILNFRDYFPKIFGVRKYICGRVFSTKEYPLLVSKSRDVSQIGKNIAKLLSLDKGPIVDDIYLTRYFRLTYGIDSIENCPTSVAYYNPITNIADFYVSQRRTVMEMYRLDLLYPAQESVAKRTSYLRKTINSPTYSQLSLINKLECLLYIILYDVCRKISMCELIVKILVVKTGISVSPINIWPSVKSSKVEFKSSLNT